jgi:site-specific recombinase XerD
MPPWVPGQFAGHGAIQRRFRRCNDTVAANIEAILLKRKKRGTDRLFGPCQSAFREAIKRSGIQLKPGTSSHVLRHTFASHFMQQGGNILTLQRILGHSDLKMTMKYAHLAPEHLEEARRLNPMALLTVG